ncbi:hypothetical protein GCM10011519_35350 [Marmoricola endophyticus]|uniref:Uncharacterized protein n=1 Tax=Marmoricola endophyticus TaxID=2040280 RepID=A0A917BW14_9ACTN|nr:hypothetical protein [Marmoricola endophyticus]GGF58437.1 hypothetical protein GCM10011519_35350 [Marmoricola endophyticus]
MLDPRFVLLGAALTLIGSSRYALATVRGRTRPNRVTWFLWALAPLIGFVAQLDDGVGWPSVLTLSIGVGPAIIFVSSLVSTRSYWRITRFDLVCGAASLVALVVWLTVPDPEYAVVAAVLADLLAGIPTIRKAWSYPETEIATTFALGLANGVITLLTLDRWDLASWAFPAYLVALMTTMLVCIVGRPGPRLAGARTVVLP